MKNIKVVAVDFDGTCVDHVYPEIGNDVPLAVSTLLWIVQRDIKLILWTMRSDNDQGAFLYDAVNWFASRGIPLWGIQKNPTQHSWTSSPKAYAQVYIDDAALGCPLRENPRMGGRPFVDWDAVRKWFQENGIHE